MEARRVEAYLRILPRELDPENVVREGYRTYLRVSLGPCDVLARRVRVYGEVSGLSRSEWRVDFSIVWGSEEALVRAWREYFDVVEDLAEGATVEVLGLIREGGGVVYVLPLIVKEKEIANWEDLVRRDRVYLASVLCDER